MKLPQPHNLLIAALPRSDRLRLLARCESVTLPLEQVLHEAGAPITHAFFPTHSFISQITQAEDGHALEVGMVGREGLLGLPLALGVSRDPLQALVQGAGSAWRLPAAELQDELLLSPALQQTLLRYAMVQLAQRAQGAACQRFHAIEARLARWLLMSHDRAGTDRFPMTQVFLARMLGVRRVGVTEAAGDLQRAGWIEYHRGDLTVRNRAGLEAAACSCYAADRQSYKATMQPLNPAAVRPAR